MKNKKIKPSVRAIKKINQKSEEIAKIWTDDGDSEINSDILGSYTGNTPDGSQPQQDADDL